VTLGQSAPGRKKGEATSVAALGVADIGARSSPAFVGRDPALGAHKVLDDAAGADLARDDRALAVRAVGMLA